ncbi:MAG: sigma-54-dependent Fis family transcriptional regulator [Deltaproteobacteria bacterium]|nr:sigma-54-dependent Fis family transcriptional regulator [Deltaproteobacteria bacterium]
MSQGKVLIVDDERDMRWLLTRVLQAEGFDVLTAEDGDEAVNVAERDTPDVILLDIRMPRVDGLTALEQMRDRGLASPVIMVTAVGEIGSAVRALRLGAYDYAVKPFDNNDLVATVKRALEPRGAAAAVVGTRPRVEAGGDLRLVMGGSPAIARVIDQIERVAPTNYTVLVEGETGTGKELVARALHHRSGRRDKPFVTVDCGAIPDTLIEAELFGHEKGSFTGAHQRRQGLIPVASGGTFFLDEVGNLPLGAQAKLLRVLQEHEVRAVGSREPIAVDVRIIAATNSALEEHVRGGTFRKDLFFRLGEFRIGLPPLRHRREDIPLLARNFCLEACTDLGRPPLAITAAAMETLVRHDWPGNARELRNAVRQAALFAPGQIDPRHLSLAEARGESGFGLEQAWQEIARGVPLGKIVQQLSGTVERALVARALANSGHNKLRAAETLQIDYKTLFRKLEKHGLQ